MTRVSRIAAGLLTVFGVIGAGSAQATFNDSITIENASYRSAIAVFRAVGDAEQRVLDIPAARRDNDASNVQTLLVTAGETLRVRDLSENGYPVLRLIEIHPTAFHGTTGTTDEDSFFITKINRTEWIRTSPEGSELRYVQIGTEPGTMTLWNPDNQAYLYLPTSDGPCTERAETDAPEQKASCGTLDVTSLSHHFTIFNSDIPFNDVTDHEKPDDTAALAGYDIDKVDPLSITDGMKRQIFQGIDNTGINYTTTGGAAHLKGLDYERINKGDVSRHSQLVYDQRSMLESWNVGIEVGVGDTDQGTPAAGKASASYSEMSGRMTENRSYFAVGREKHSLYSMRPILGYALLHRDFVDAVDSLPLPPSSTGTPQALPPLIFGAYEAFVQEWGGFYPINVVYGSASFFSEEITSTKIEEVSEKGWNAKLELEGAIKGVPVSGSVAGGQSTQEKVMFGNEDATSKFRYVGGDGSGAPNFGTAQPVDIEFGPISHLLTPVSFGQRIPFEDLEQKRQALEAVVQTMYPAGPDTVRDPLQFYDIELTSMTVTAQRSPNGGVYGKVLADSAVPEGAIPLINTTRLTAFSRSSAPGARVTMEKSVPFNFDGGKRRRVAIARTATSTDDPVSFTISAPLSMWYLLEKPDLSGSTTCNPATTSEDDPRYGSWTDFKFTSTHKLTPDYKIEVKGRCRAVPRWMVRPMEWEQAKAHYVCNNDQRVSTSEEIDAAEKILIDLWGRPRAIAMCSVARQLLIIRAELTATK